MLHDSAGERADADLCCRQIHMIASYSKGVLNLVEHSAVAFDNPLWDTLVAVPRRVGDHQAMVRRLRRRDCGSHD